ncbi:MAG: NTP transferase domain-containing protein [Actinobacteria bacterium]|nr:NTP transferase domain-containing protein [Actinomycetota bacterium]
MKAIILAAGFGTRLLPLTKEVPKALIRLAGKPLLEILLKKMLTSGFDEIAVNVHHHADKIQSYLDDFMQNHKARIYVSYEPEVLDTGGGIKKMIPLLGMDEPILVHNVDIISNIDLHELFEKHKRLNPDVTLVVQQRKTDRYLLFDESMQFCGRGQPDLQGKNLICLPKENVKFLAFCGIQVINPKIFINYERRKFSSIDLYIDYSKEGGSIIGAQYDDFYWRDIGKLEELNDAEKDISEKKFSI